MVIETKEGLKILKGLNNYEALFINSSRIEDCINYLRNNNLKKISINPYQGYDAKDLNFLSKIDDFIEGISILDEKFDYSIVNSLHNLKSLGFADNKKDIINLSNFPNLDSLSCEYSIRLKGLESCINLKRLTISNYKSKAKDLSYLPSLKNLEHLSLIKPDITTMQGIEHLSSLTTLEIFSASKLETIAPLQALQNSLKEIQIEQCKKINDFEVLGKVQALKKVILLESGEIKSLSFVKQLPKLEFISFWGTNVLDGNIKYCEGINYVGFDNKKHYTIKSEQFKK